MPTENIRVVVQGPNAQTFSVQANIPTGGSTSVSVPLTGVNLGTDIVQAFFDLQNLASNQAQVVWQNTNGPIAISPITVYYQAGSGGGIIPAGIGPSGFSDVLTVNSLMFNTHPQSILPGDPHQSGNQANPMVNNAITVNGTYSGDIAIPGDHGGVVFLSLVGSFVVAQPGTVDFTGYSNASFLIGCPGATFAGGAQIGDGVTTTPIKGYPIVAGRNGSFPGGNTYTDNFSLHFATSGVFPFEIIFASGPNSERQFNLLANSGVIPPIALASVPPPPPAGTGQLILTPNNAGPDIQGTTQQFTLSISGITFSSTPYIPVFEGQSGEVHISNSPNGAFNFPAIPGGASVNYQAAISALLSLSGDNGEWQSRVSITPDNHGSYLLNFNGNAVDPNTELTNLTVTVDDLAWFNGSNNSFDVYGISSQGGGASLTVPIYWLVMPQVASVGPSTLPGDGGTHTAAVNLVKPLPPLQTNIQATFTGTGGLTVTETVVNLNSAGWVTGWTLKVTTPRVGGNTTCGINMNATGSITYLTGPNFVTNNVTYINGSVGSITVT